MISVTAEQRSEHLRWLLELTSIPTASGKEARVIAWIERWVAERAAQGVTLSRDPAGNLVVRSGGAARSTSQGLSGGFGASEAPLLITAHVDHPAFVVEGIIGAPEATLGGEAVLSLSFRGGVMDAYFEGARIVVYAADGRRLPGTIVESENAQPHRTALAEMDAHVDLAAIRVGDVATWDLPPACEREGLIHAPACDDLAGVAAALAAFAAAMRAAEADGRALARPLGLLFTRAEEVGFIGAIAACKHGTIPPGAKILALETSRSFADSPIGGGPIVRVGDRAWTFSPTLTGAVAKVCEKLAEARKASDPSAKPFAWQRKLMAGGTCEATCYGAYGHDATCLCLALGNYHNMGALDAVQGGDAKQAKIEPEIISRADFEGLVDVLAACARGLDEAEPLVARMERLYAEKAGVLG